MSFIDYNADSNNLGMQNFYGVVVGIVADVDDPEKIGRVKVKLPVMLKDKVTFWARVAVAFAGKKQGFFMLPDVGEEVLIAFGNGDIKEPYIIGSLWNKEEAPDKYKTDSGKFEKRSITFRQGQQIIVNETESEAYIEIKTKNDNSVFINDKDDGEIIIKTKSGKNKIVIDGNTNKIRVEADDGIVIKSGSSKLEISSNGNEIALSSDSKINIKTSALTLQSSGSLDIKSDGMVSIKGSMVKLN